MYTCFFNLSQSDSILPLKVQNHGSLRHVIECTFIVSITNTGWGPSGSSNYLIKAKMIFGLYLVRQRRCRKRINVICGPFRFVLRNNRITLTFRASAKSLLWICCPDCSRGKVLAVGLHCSPSDLGKRCKVVNITSLFPLLLHVLFLSSRGPTVLQLSLSSPWSDLIDEWTLPLLSILVEDQVNAELCKTPSPSSLFGLSSCLSSSSAFSDSCQDDTQYLFKLFLLWHR